MSHNNNNNNNKSETVNSGKKRKVFRNGATSNSSSNSTNGSLLPPPPNMLGPGGRTRLTPEAAANYIQQATEAIAASTSALAAASRSVNENVKITLGPPILDGGNNANNNNNNMRNNNHATIAGAAMGMSMASAAAAAGLATGTSSTSGSSSQSSSSSSSVSFGNLDLAALKAGDLSYFTAAAASRNAKRNSAGPNNAAAASASNTNTTATAGNNNNSGAGAIGNNPGNRKTDKEGLPCSEAEMKALMSMFVEIMGMSMDTDKLGKSSKKKNNLGLLDPGWKWPADGMIPKEWDVLPPTYEDDDDDDDEDDDEDDDDEDSLPDLDDVNEMCRNAPNATSLPTNISNTMGTMTNKQGPHTSGSTGIAPVEWESLEQVAIEDAMEAEERARKAAKRREKKNRKKEKARKEAAEKAAEAAQKKREKTILSWRSRVVSACQSNEVARLEALLAESPLRSEEKEGGDVTPHLEFLLPNIVAKNRQQAERGKEARTVLSTYILNTSVPVVFTPLRTGRSALHTACFYGEHDFVQQVIHAAKEIQTKLSEQQQQQQQQSSSTSSQSQQLPQSYLNITCQDSGWSPLHYSVFSGSQDIMETLLASGCDVKTKTNDAHTWKSNNGKGITARELAESVLAGTHEKIFETHGIALQEVSSHFLSHSEEKRKFLKLLERIIERLKDVERNGYSPRKTNDLSTKEEEEVADSKVSSVKDDNDEELERQNSIVSSESANRNKKKKKKKKQQQQQQLLQQQQQQERQQQQQLQQEQELEQQQQEQEQQPTTKANLKTSDSKNDNEKDPLVSALLGMGFTEEQIHAAVKACGGTDRATADDLVAWIFAEESGEHATENASSAQAQPVIESMPTVTEIDKATASAEEEVKRAKEAKRAEETAKREEEARLVAQRLAAKREETRRRNREWNNRTQARQREEEQAKLLELRAKAAAQATAQRTQSQTAATSTSGPGSGINAPPPSFFPAVQTSNATGATPAVATTSASNSFGQMKLSGQTSTKKNAGDGQLKGPKILSKADAPKMSRDNSIHKNKQLVQQQSKQLPNQLYRGDLGSQYPPMGDTAPSQYPHVSDPGMTQVYPPMSDNGMASQGYLTLADMTAQGYPPINDVSAQQGYHSMVDMTSHGYPHMAEIPAHGYGQMSDVISQGFSQMNADDSTVSSLGSGLSKVAPSAVNSSIPPGFRPSSTLPPQTEESSYDVNDNPLGEMRATAREFVPSTFTSSSMAKAPPVAAGNMPHYNSNAPVDQMDGKTRLRAFSASDAALMASSAVSMPSAGSAAGIGSFPASSLLGTSGSRVHSSMAANFERLAVSGQCSPVPPSAASSVTGVSTLAEESLIGGPAATNVLETISSSGLSSTSSFDNNGPTGNSNFLWGGLQTQHNANVTSNVGIGSHNSSSTSAAAAGLSLMGLPSFSSRDTAGLLGSTTSRQPGGLGPRLDGMTGQAAMESNGIGGGWGSGLMGNGASGTGGSIW